MHLHYIWFHDFSLFQDQGFQLDAKRRYEFDAESGNMTVNRNPANMQGFFNPAVATDPDMAVISNITAIVGENGAGKTNFLKYIKQFLVRAQSRDIHHALVVMENEQNDVIILYDDTVIPRLQIQDPDSLLGQNPQVYGKVESWNKLPDNAVLFYSGIFDHDYEEGLTNYYNLSTNYLARRDQVRRMEDGMNSMNQHSLDIHRDEDMNRQVILVHEYPRHFNDPFPMRLPEQLIVRIREFDGKDDEKSLGRFANFYGKVNQYLEIKIQEIQQNFSKLQSSNERIQTKRAIFQYRAFRTLIRSFLKELSIYMHDHLLKVEDTSAETDNLVNDKQSFSTDVKNFFEKMRNRAVVYNAPQDVEWLTCLIGMVEAFEHFSYAVEPLDWMDSAFAIPIRPESVQASESHQFLDLYRRSYSAYPYLDFRWSDLSSGEKAFLNLLARLYTRADGQPFGSNVVLTKQILLLIDEGDLYFHPEWQRTFIQRLVGFLSVIYRPKRSIQIILTSHSPFSLSDLPSFSVN